MKPFACLLAFTLFTFGTLAAPDETRFSLKDKDGLLYGPFPAKTGTLIKIGKTEVTISEVIPASKAVIDKLQSIVLPEIDFRQAQISDVVDFLRRQSQEFDNRESDVLKKGVNIVLSKRVPVPVRSAVTNDPFEVTEKPGTEQELVTFVVRHVSLGEVIQIVCSIAGLTYRVESWGVLIEPSDTTYVPVRTKVYDLRPDFEAMASGALHRDPTNGAPTSADVVQMLASFGVKSSQVTSVVLFESQRKLVVAGPGQWLRECDGILGLFTMPPWPVLVEAKLVALPGAAADAGEPAKKEASRVMEQVSRGKGSQIASWRIWCMAGTEGTVTISGTPNQDADADPFPTRLTVLPRANFSTKNHTLELSLSAVQESGHQDKGGAIPPARVTFDTTLTVADGEWTLAGAVPSHVPGTMIHLLVKASSGERSPSTTP